MRTRFLFAVAFVGVLVSTPSARAFGPWLEKTPIGGVELSEGWSRAELERRFDEIKAENAARPFIVTRTKWMTTIFDHVRLAVNTNDCFVHWHTDGMIMPNRFMARTREVMPERGSVWVEGPGSLSALDLSHTCPDWKSVLALGPSGLAARARKRRETAKTDDERLFLDCVAEVYDGLVRECRRWAAFAESKGMRDVAAVLRENAAHEPRTFREALQWALVYDRAQEAEGEDVRAQGLFDRLFIRFYRDDLAAGRETRASAKRLLADWYTLFWRQQHDNNKNIAFGGYDEKGEPVWNELTELGFEVFDELGRVNPKLTYRFGRKTPREQVEKVAACVTHGHNSIVFSCDETLYEAFRRRGKDERDLCDYVLVGCYEPGIGGREIVSSMTAHFALPKAIEAVFNGGRDFAGATVGPACPLPETAEAFEREYFRQLKAMVDRTLDQTVSVERHWYEINPAPLFSGAFADCIDRAADYSRAGCRYNSSGVVFVGIGTAADSLAAIRHLVDDRKLVTMRELGEILRNDWKGHETLRLEAMRAAPKWGNNDPCADACAKRIYDCAAGLVNGRPNGHGGCFNAGFWSIYLDLSYGKNTWATPDGRFAGKPLSRNNCAVDGCGREGPTALMHSNLRLDLAESPDGHVMDILLPSSMAKGPTGARDIAAIVATYFERGGQCLHLNCLDAQTLRDAQAHPDRYPDLQIRVCGWNVRWNDLSKVEQDHFIVTAETQERSH